MELLQELNEKQQQAAAHTNGAILVVAGPGTGKTNVITHRIAHLIRNHQVAPQQIFAVTFTNKAAQEMLDRIKELLGQTQGLEVRIHTFHAFCVRLLRRTRRRNWIWVETSQFSVRRHKKRCSSNVCVNLVRTGSRILRGCCVISSARTR